MRSPDQIRAVSSSAEVRGKQQGTANNSTPKDSAVQPDVKKVDVVKAYEAKLKSMKYVALITSAFHSLTWFLGFCALTWATCVILGGYIGSLEIVDFYYVSVLLVLEACRLAVAVFFGHFITRGLVSGSTDPSRIQSARQTSISVVRIVNLATQLVIIGSSVILPIRRLHNLMAIGNVPGHTFVASLRIFYMIVLVNACLATVATVHSNTVVLWFASTYSLAKYYDHIIWRGMDQGLLHTTDFDFVAFAFKAQSDEYRRNQKAEKVGELYKDLIEYLYEHKKGCEAARISLDSEDTYEQEAAANIVGMWADLKAKRGLRLRKRLLAKLAEVVDNEETGRAATNSFFKLASVDPEGARNVRSTENGDSIMDILIKRVEEVVQAGEHDKAVVYTQALMPMLKGMSMESRRNMKGLNELKVNLHKILGEGQDGSNSCKDVLQVVEKVIRSSTSRASAMVEHSTGVWRSGRASPLSRLGRTCFPFVPTCAGDTPRRCAEDEVPEPPCPPPEIVRLAVRLYKKEHDDIAHVPPPFFTHRRANIMAASLTFLLFLLLATLLLIFL